MHYSSVDEHIYTGILIAARPHPTGGIREPVAG